MLTLISAVAVGASLIGAPAATATSPPAPPRVLVIGDSVLTAVLWRTDTLALLKRGFDMELDVGVCRRLTGVSCPTLRGDRVPTLVQVAAGRGTEIAPTVVVSVGYNDLPATFQESVESAVTALVRAGARRILWVNLREQQAQFALMNRVLRGAAVRYPELTILDWNALSRNQAPWFQSDGIHLGYAGAVAMATLVHTALRRAFAPPFVAVTRHLPVAFRGMPYRARLVARGGTPPYRWRSAAGPLPRGLHLRADGRIVGMPTRTAGTPLTLVAEDANGSTATVSASILVQRSRARSSLASTSAR